MLLDAVVSSADLIVVAQAGEGLQGAVQPAFHLLARIEGPMSTTNLLQARNGIEVVRGATQTYTVTVTDEAGKIFDLTGSRLVFSVKGDVSDRTVLVLKTTDGVSPGITYPSSNPRLGVAKVTLLPADTEKLPEGDYVYDFWAQLPTGERYVLVRPSLLRVLPRVTVFP